MTNLDILEYHINNAKLPMDIKLERDDVAQMMVWWGNMDIYEKVMNTQRSAWVSALSIDFKLAFLYDEICDGKCYFGIAVD
jgi:hypothetical protein